MVFLFPQKNNFINVLKRAVGIIVIASLMSGQLGLAQVPSQIPLPAYLSNLPPIQDRFRPVHLRSISFNDTDHAVGFILDKGDTKEPARAGIETEAGKLSEYFQIGLRLPDRSFWVNLRPDSPLDIIDPAVEKTDVGRILLEADVQLKRDLARFTAPKTVLGKMYWDKLYAKAEYLFGQSDAEIPTVTRPWIVPGEILLGESPSGAYVYKALLKVCLEQDHIRTPSVNDPVDPRFSALNEYSSELLRNTIIPELTREVNTSRRYAGLRQVYYSLILAQWFKKKYGQQSSASNIPAAIKALTQAIDCRDTRGLTSRMAWSKEAYFKAYQESFQKGEYNTEETIAGPAGITIRRYFSGGIIFEPAASSMLKDGGRDNLATPGRLPDIGAVLSRKLSSLVRVTADVVEDGKFAVSKLALPGRKDHSRAEDIPLDEYIQYKKIALAEQGRRPLIETSDLSELRSKIEKAGYGRANINALITRQAETIEQAILELVSNASDALTGRTDPVGRFGMGGLQQLAFVIEGGTVTVDTSTAAGAGRSLMFTRGQDKRVYFNTNSISKDSTGTKVDIEVPPSLRGIEGSVEAFLKDRLNLFTKMPVYLNGECINRLESSYVYLNGEAVKYDFPDKRIDIRIENGRIIVEDKGSGMTDDVVFNKYLVPRLGENNPVPREQTENEISDQVHLFYRAPQDSENEREARIVFQVSGVNIQSFTIAGYNLPKELIIQLPSSTRLPVSRNEIEIDAGTHTATKALGRKIARNDPRHQFELMNGFMLAVKLLDEKNKRVGALHPLLDTAKEELIPLIIKLDRLVLPNDALFHQIEYPQGTLFLDQSLIYRISPEQIPGSEDISAGFRAGTFKKAYSVPFRADSKVSYLAFGPYLLINKAIYEKYKAYPLLLNLRLNFFVGYGRRNLDKGWILPYEERLKEEERNKTGIAPFLKNRPALCAVITEKQKQWLADYLKEDLRDERALDVLLDRLDTFVEQVPDALRLIIDWDKIFPFSNGRKTAFQDLLNFPGQIFLPDMEFLAVHSAYFANRERPERLDRYIANLLRAGQMSAFAGNAVLHPLLSQIDEKALNAIDSEILDSTSQVFKDKNLEAYEDCFKAINEGLVHVGGEAAKRLILRWMRIYKNDAKAANTFYELLKKEYRREIEDPESITLQPVQGGKGRVEIIKTFPSQRLGGGNAGACIRIPDGKYKGCIALVHERNISPINSILPSIQIIDPDTGIVVEQISSLAKVPGGIAYIGDDKIVYTSGSSIFVHSIGAKTDKSEFLPPELEHPFVFTSVVSLGDGCIAVTDINNQVALFFDTKTLRSEVIPFMIAPRALAAMGPHKLAVVDHIGSGEHQIKIIDRQTKEIIRKIKLHTRPHAMDYFDDGKLAVIDFIACGLSVIDVESGEYLLDNVRFGMSFGEGIASLGNGEFAVTSSASQEESILRIIKAEIPEKEQRTSVDFSAVRNVTVLEGEFGLREPQDSAMISGGTYKGCIAVADDKNIKIIDLKEQKVVFSVPTDDYIYDITYMENNELAVVFEGCVATLDIERPHSYVKVFGGKEGFQSPLRLAYIGNRRLAVSDGVSMLKILDVDTDQIVAQSNLPMFAGLTLVGNNKLAAASPLDDMCYIVDLDSDGETAPRPVIAGAYRFNGPDILAALGDHKLAVHHWRDKGSITIVDYEKGEILWHSKDDERCKGMDIQGMSYVGDGKLAVILSGQKPLVILDFAEQKGPSSSGAYAVRKMTVISEAMAFKQPGACTMIPEGAYKGCIAVYDQEEEKIRILDPDTQKVLQEIAFIRTVTDIAYIGDNKLAVGCDEGRVLVIVSLADGWLNGKINDKAENAYRLAYMGNGDLAMGGSPRAGEVIVYDLETERYRLKWDRSCNKLQDVQIYPHAMAYLGKGLLAIDSSGSIVIMDMAHPGTEPEVLLRGAEQAHYSNIYAAMAKMGEDKLAVWEYCFYSSDEASGVLRIIDLKQRKVIWDSQGDGRFSAMRINAMAALSPDKLAITDDKEITVIEFGPRQSPEFKKPKHELVAEDMPLVEDVKVVYNATGPEMSGATYIGKYKDGNPLYVSMEDHVKGAIKIFMIDRKDGQKHELADLDTGLYFQAYKFCFTGFNLNDTDPVFCGRISTSDKFFVFNTKDNTVKEIASIDRERHPFMEEKVEFTGLYEDNNPVFIAYGVKAAVFVLDLTRNKVSLLKSVDAKRSILELKRTDVQIGDKNVYLCIDDLDLMMLTYDGSTKQIEYHKIVDVAGSDDKEPVISTLNLVDPSGRNVPVRSVWKEHMFQGVSFTPLAYQGKPVVVLYEGPEKLFFASLDAEARSFEVIKCYCIADIGSLSAVSLVATKDIVYDPVDAELLVTRYAFTGADILPGVISWDLSKAVGAGRTKEKPLPLRRTGFGALDSRDDLSGLPSLERNLVRFLREKDIEFVEEGFEEPRDPSWKEMTDICKDGPIPLALINYCFEKNSRYIKTNPQIGVQEFQDMLKDVPVDIDLSAYQQIIASAIESQDRTERVWIREAGLQNPRDAIRKEREEGRMPMEEGVISHSNFISGSKWIYSIKDPVGMNFWKQIRYYFPLDESSKDHLKDTGNLGQGNYTLYADYNEIFVRTSEGDGIISEIVIRDDPATGPTIIKWSVLEGFYKGTEVRRKKDTGSSDPQLESLFIQECLQRFGGAIQSPRSKKEQGRQPDVRDVEILYNGRPFADDIIDVSRAPIGEGWGTVALGRIKERFKKGVTQDGIYIKAPDLKELLLVPERIAAAFERFGGIHIRIPREVLLNIPRNGYSQEHKFIHSLRLAVLYAMMQAVLTDYMERSAPVPGFPADYYTNAYSYDDSRARQIALYLSNAQYDKVTEAMLQPYLDNPAMFFELLTHIPFESEKHNGEVTLHYIREELIREAELRKARTEAVDLSLSKLSDIFRGKDVSGEFLEDITEAAGGIGALKGQGIGGFLGAAAAVKNMQLFDKSRQIPDEIDSFHPFVKRILRCIGIEAPQMYYVYSPDPASAFVVNGEKFFWNLENTGDRIKNFIRKIRDGSILQELKDGRSSNTWELLETVFHESQHFKKFENPGDHTHHSDETLDDGFAARMGKAMDAALFGMAPEDIITHETEKPGRVSDMAFHLLMSSGRDQEAQDKKAADGGSLTGAPGGVDLRSLPAVIVQAQTTAQFHPDPAVQLAPHEAAELDRQWCAIRAQIRAAGIIPCKQTKEFVACCKQKHAIEHLGEVAAYLAEVLREEESAVIPTDPEIKQILREIG